MNTYLYTASEQQEESDCHSALGYENYSDDDDIMNHSPDDNGNHSPDDPWKCSPDDCGNHSPDDHWNYSPGDCGNYSPDDRGNNHGKYSPDDCWYYSPDDHGNQSPDGHGNQSPDDHGNHSTGDFDMYSAGNNKDIYLADDHGSHSHVENVVGINECYSTAVTAKDGCLAKSKKQPKMFLKDIYVVVHVRYLCSCTCNVNPVIYMCFIYFRKYFIRF